jgi:hypothetical protein
MAKSQRNRAEEAHEKLWRHIVEYSRQHLEGEIQSPAAAQIAANLIADYVDRLIDEDLTEEQLLEEWEAVRNDATQSPF